MANKYNNLNGKEWLQYSFSIWRDIRKEDEERKLQHPAMFPVQLAERIIEIFSKSEDLILDPFMGTGSTIVAAYRKKRNSIGFELSSEFVSIFTKRLNEEKCNLWSKECYEPIVYTKDARELLEYVNKESIHLCITSPPYWDILNMHRTADRKEIKNYSESKIDLGNISDYNEFLYELIDIFSKVYKTLKINGHCVVILMDIRKKDKFYPFHSDFANKMQEIGFTFEDIIIWDRQHEYNNMRPLGYPYVFRVNKVHEYILIFRKREN